ncbi:uncharacterized protein [Nothobranchius furzeri]|uniref:uncharacterized protein n=1 Tax=Nothobranchius furzeri TaxID=105023 RepID=UPI002403B76B|nr:uncharacterized protein LOC129155859 [Nothobranchius furzeri]XP_054592938.1 uncharacterized protein LOC107374364 isoform X1 [Nothobranchius furzeri]
MDSYVLFKGTKRLTLKEEDMTTEKISRIFQVHCTSLYITDDSNVAIFPGNDGRFSTLDLLVRGHYEVHGEGMEESSSVPASYNPTRFSFHRPQSTAGASTSSARPSPRVTVAKTFQRTIFIAELVDGRLETSKTLTVRFSEFEASVVGITRKVNEALEQEELIILTDGQGNKILETEGTRGSAFWKQNARKVLAVREEDFLQLQGSKKRKLSRRDDNGLDAVYDQIEEVILAAQGLREVSTTIRELTELANSNRSTAVSLRAADAAAVKDAFACVVCKGPVVEPIVATCCQSLIGCLTCTEEWKKNSAFCPKCRADEFGINTVRVTGLSDALAALGNALWQ